MCKGQLPLMVAWTNRRAFGGVGSSPRLGVESTAAHDVSAGPLPRPAVSLATPSAAQPRGFGVSNFLDELPASSALFAEVFSGKSPEARVDARRPLPTTMPRGHGQFDCQRGLSGATNRACRDSLGSRVKLAQSDEPVAA